MGGPGAWSDHRPMELLADQREVDELYECPLQVLADHFPVMRGRQGRKIRRIRHGLHAQVPDLVVCTQRRSASRSRAPSRIGEPPRAGTGSVDSRPARRWLTMPTASPRRPRADDLAVTPATQRAPGPPPPHMERTPLFGSAARPGPTTAGSRCEPPHLLRG